MSAQTEKVGYCLEELLPGLLEASSLLCYFISAPLMSLTQHLLGSTRPQAHEVRLPGQCLLNTEGEMLGGEGGQF